MNRTIKFRGKRIDNGQWVYGDLVQCAHDILILPINTGWTHHKVIPETVGQFTGLLDKNGREIYEGDVITHDYEEDSECFIEVRFVRQAFSFFWRGNIYNECSIQKNIKQTLMEVAGNIHDHPELLSSKQ